MASFYLTGLSENQKFCLKEFGGELPFTYDTDGVPVQVQPGTANGLRKSANGVELTYAKPHMFYRVLSMLTDFWNGKDTAWEEQADFDLLCYMADMSRNAVYNIPTAKQTIRLLALAGYDSLMLYTEETYEIPEYPYFGYMRGRFTKEELKELDAYAERFGMEIIPCIQTLAHLARLFQWGPFAKVRDTSDILLAGDEETYRLIDAMLKTCRECFRSNRINIGMDEAHMLGLGRYLDHNGYHPKSEIMLSHLSRVVELCKKYGYAPMMWSDMFFRMQFNGNYRVREGEVSPEVRKLVPPEVALVYWDYYSMDSQIFNHMVECHKQFSNPLYFAGGASKWYGFAPLNAMSIRSAGIQMSSCCLNNVRNIIVTGWGDNGGEASQFSVMPSLQYYAEYLYAKAEPSRELLDRRCREVYDIGLDDLLVLDCPNHLSEKDSDAVRTNPCKYLLYNDLFYGIMDLNLEPDTVAAAFRRNAEALKPLCVHPRWGYLYGMLYRLCDLLTLKGDCSVRIRKAYRGGDRDTLQKIANEEIPEMVSKLDLFLEAFRNQWYRENKTFGFELQEIRLGGCRARWQSVAAYINGYLDGRYNRIEELEQEQLPFAGRAPEQNPYILFNAVYPMMSPADRQP